MKGAAELALILLANDITLQVYKAAWKSLKPGMTNSEFSGLIAAGYGRVGFPGEASCQVDAWSALPHGPVQPQVIREGSIVLIDAGCVVEGYKSDISRTFVVGRPTDRMKRVIDAVHKAQTAALKAAKPGVPCEADKAGCRGPRQGSPRLATLSGRRRGQHHRCGASGTRAHLVFLGR